jgi:hypothetical protein
MGRRKLHYKEGDWFAVPLPSGGYALGLIARMKAPATFGYFFGPRRPVLPRLADAENLRPEEALDRADFGDLDLLNHEWPVLGQLTGWDRSRWPMPRFVNKDVISGQIRLITRDDNDPGEVIARDVASPEEAAGLPADGCFGSLALARHLDRLLRQLEAECA